MSGPNSTSLPGNGGVEEWLELESDPGVFSLLIEDYGVRGVKVEEVYDVSKKFDSEVFGFVFLFRYELTDRRARKKARDMTEIDSYVLDDGVVNTMFFAHQIITNSCATHALLSVLLNCQDLDIGPNLQRLKEFTKGLDPESKGFAIANMMELAHIHNKHARPLRTLAQPASGRKSLMVSSAFALMPETYHYVSFVPINGRLFELDGLKEYPMDHGPWGEHEKWTDLFQRTVTQRFLESQDCLFNLMALIPDPVPQISECLKRLQNEQALLLESAANLARQVIAEREQQKTNTTTPAPTPPQSSKETKDLRTVAKDDGSLPAVESSLGDQEKLTTSNENENMKADESIANEDMKADDSASNEDMKANDSTSNEDMKANDSASNENHINKKNADDTHIDEQKHSAKQSADNVDPVATSTDPSQIKSEGKADNATLPSQDKQNEPAQSTVNQPLSGCDDSQAQPTTDNPLPSTADCEGTNDQPQSPVKAEQLNSTSNRDQEQSATSNKQSAELESATETKTSVCAEEGKCLNASSNQLYQQPDTPASDSTNTVNDPKIKREEKDDFNPNEEPMDISEPPNNTTEASLLNEISRALPTDSSELDTIADTPLDGNLSLNDRLRISVAKVVKNYKEADEYKQKLKEEVETKQRFRVEHSRRTHDYDTFIFDFVKCLAQNKQLPERVLRRPSVAPPTRGHLAGRRKRKRGMSGKPRTTLLLNGSKVD